MNHDEQSAVVAAAPVPQAPPVPTPATEDDEDEQMAQDDEGSQGPEDDDDDDQEDGQNNSEDDADNDAGARTPVKERHISDTFKKDEIADNPVVNPPDGTMKTMQRHIFDRLQHNGPGSREGSTVMFAWPGAGVVATKKADSFRQTQTDVIMQVSTIRPHSSSATR